MNKKVFENEILTNMDLLLQPSLVKSASAQNNLGTAVEYLNSAAEIFDDLGFTKKSEEIVSLLEVLANKPKNPLSVSDSHTKGLTPDKQIKNLLDHGTQFNMADDGDALLDLDVNDADLEVLEKEMSDMDFEDEV
jgi:hypothetical protein